MDALIRTPRPADAAALASLAAELGYAVTPEAALARLERLAREGGHLVRVAEVEGAAVGWLHAREEWSLEGGGCAELATLVVDAAHRSRGIGARLVAEAEAWARARGMDRVRVRSRADRAAAHRFYRRLGYQDVKVQAVLDKALAPGTPC